MQKQTLHTQDESRFSPWLIFLLSALVAVSPLAIDMYLPAMPGMRDYFGTSISQVQLTMSSYLAGFAIFHLVCGPLSDRFGRRPLILGGIGLFTISSFASAHAQSIEQLILLRFAQGMGACCGPTLGRAMVRDIYGAEHAGKAMAYMIAIMALAPTVAPMIGGLLLVLWDWQAIFYVLTIYGVLGLIVIYRWLPESLPCKQPIHPLSVLNNYGQLLQNKRYILLVLACAITCPPNIFGNMRWGLKPRNR